MGQDKVASTLTPTPAPVAVGTEFPGSTTGMELRVFKVHDCPSSTKATTAGGAALSLTVWVRAIKKFSIMLPLPLATISLDVIVTAKGVGKEKE